MNRWITRVVLMVGCALAWPVRPAQAVVFNLAGPPEPVRLGGEVSLDLVVLNPSVVDESLVVPDHLAGVLSDGRRDWPVELRASALGGTVSIRAGGFAVYEFIMTLPEEARGRLVLAIDKPTAAKVALEVNALTEAVTLRSALTNIAPPRTAEAAVKRVFAGRFGAHNPIYFIYGNERQGAKFQFSFKYRVLGTEAALGESIPALRRLYFGYTQRSLWDIDAESSPFYDTSYMPELMFESQTVLDPNASGGFKWLGYQIGARHESNGRSGLTSRSLNTVYFRPALALGRFEGWHAILAPQFSAYVSDLSNNPDIELYRGHVELQAILGRGAGPSLVLTSRLGNDRSKGSFQADLNIPVDFDRMFDFATYVLIQYWRGYGESLLDYNAESSAVRIGITLVR